MEIIFFNAVAATALALPVALLARRLRRPALLHALWLLVLLRLIAPPAFELGLVPRWENSSSSPAQRSAVGELETSKQFAGSQGTEALTQPVEQSVPRGKLEESGTISSARDLASATRSHLDPGETTARILKLAFFLAATGTLLLLALSLLRLVRFRRQLRGVPAGSPAFQERLARLAKPFRLDRVPRIRVVASKIPPSLRPGWGRCEILFPEGLLARLHDDELDAILAHELAHLRRRDHWIRPLELLIVALYWWHPVAWWARRHLRNVEEQACDAMVLQNLGGHSRVYAQSLLKTVEFLTPYEPAVPLLATGVNGTSQLKERIKMILTNNSLKPMPSSLRPVLYAVLALFLLVTPGWAEKPNATPEKPAEIQDKVNPEQEHQQQLLEIQQQEFQIQRQLQQLERQRQSVQLKIDQKRTQQGLEQMRQKLAALKKEGRLEDAERLERQIASAELEAKLHQQKLEAELAYGEERAQIEYKLQDLQLEMYKAQLQDDNEHIQALTEQTFALQQELQRLELKTMQAELERNRERYEQEKKELQEMQK
jgi:beta-lactamase regulating signal transducer with metallopeptidase domain